LLQNLKDMVEAERAAKLGKKGKKKKKKGKKKVNHPYNTLVKGGFYLMAKEPAKGCTSDLVAE